MTATGGADRNIGANADLSSCDAPSVNTRNQPVIRRRPGVEGRRKVFETGVGSFKISPVIGEQPGDEVKACP